MGGLGSRTRNPSITDPYIHTTIMATTPQSWADVCKNSPKTQTQPQGRTQPQPPHHQWDLQCPRDMWDVAHATTMVASHNTTNTMTNTWNQPVCEKCGYNLDGGGLCGCSNAAW